MNRAILSVALAFLLGTCTVDVPEPADALFACEKDEDCSSDWYCDTRVRRCVDPKNPPGNPCDTLPCNPGESCILNDSQPDGYFCSACGNGQLDRDEECDGPEPAGQSCATKGLGIGSLGCNPDTCTWDTTNCWEPPSGWYGPGTGGSPAEIASGDLASNPDIAIDEHGRPIVVYTHTVNLTTTVHVSRFEGSQRQWEHLNSGDPLSDPNGNAQRPRVAVSPDGRIGVVYRQGIAVNHEIQFRQFSGDGWGSAVTLESCTVTDGCMRPDLAYNPANGSFAAVWKSDRQIHAAAINAENVMNAIPSPSAGDTFAHDQPAIAINADGGEVTVAWQADSGTNTAIYVKRWDTGISSWQPVGWVSAGGGVTDWGDNSSPSVARDGYEPLALAWQRPVGSETEGALLIWDGNNWANRGGNEVAVAQRPYIGFLNVAMAGAEPALVWQDGSSVANSAGNVLVSFWRNGAWREAPEPSASPGAIDVDDWGEGTGQTQVATGPNGVGDRQMCVTWSQKFQMSDGGFFNVFVRCRLFP